MYLEVFFKKLFSLIINELRDWLLGLMYFDVT
jgi:hypothetical protein